MVFAPRALFCCRGGPARQTAFAHSLRTRSKNGGTLNFKYFEFESGGRCREWTPRRLQAQQTSASHFAAEVDCVVGFPEFEIGKLRKALRINTASIQPHEVTARGTGSHLGVPINWQCSWAPDGGFLEEVHGELISFKWGCLGGKNPKCWQVDSTGVVSEQMLDDYECTLLTTWLRTGQWLFPAVIEQLHITLNTEKVNGDNGSNGSNGAENGDGETVSETDEKSVEETNGAQNDDYVRLDVRLKQGRVTATLAVDRTSWLPVRIEQRISGDVDTWEMFKWKLYGKRVAFPGEVLHKSAAGGAHKFKTEECILQRNPSEMQIKYAMPKSGLMPSDASYDFSTSPTVKAWITRGEHVLVRPLINGKDIGYMILDTGASGSVIEKSAAEELNLDAFGEMFVSGMAGKVRSRFRCAESIQLGPLTIKKPLFMEMPISGLVLNGPQPVVGIIGYDFFRRAVVEMEPLSSNSDKKIGEENEPNFKVVLHDIESYETDQKARDVSWVPLRMIANLPHVEAKYCVGMDICHEGLFMLDTGAGGAGVMFFGPVLKRLDLAKQLNGKAMQRFMKGVGGTSTRRVAVNGGVMDWIELSDHKHKQVSCLFMDTSNFDITVYGTGVLCMSVLTRCRVILDYARQRGALVPLTD